MKFLLFFIFAFISSESLSFTLKGINNNRCYKLNADINDTISLAYMISGLNEFSVLVTINNHNMQNLYSNYYKTREGNFIYKVIERGLYSLCFQSFDKSFKSISFEFLIKNKEEFNNDYIIQTELNPIRSILLEIDDKLNNISRNLHFYQQRTIAYHNLTDSTHNKILWSALLKLGVLILVLFLRILGLTRLFIYPKRINV